jgi:hypothetical protein
MNYLVGLLVVLAIVAVYLIQRTRGPSATSKPAREDSAKVAGLRQNLRLKLGYDEAKIDRLIELERERMPRASLQALMEAAIERWERDNR